MNEFKQSIETYKAIKEDYNAIFARRAKGQQISELELANFIGRIKDSQPLMFAQEQRKDLREMAIVVNNLMGYMQIKQGKQTFQGIDYSLWNVLNPKPAIVTLAMLEAAVSE